MSKSLPSKKSRRLRLKTLPWAALLQTAMVFGKRWRSLSEKERSRLTTLVKESGGRLGNLSEKERKELKRIAGKLDLKGMVRDLVPIIRGGRKRRRRS
jgi:hypothetical protein